MDEAWGEHVKVPAAGTNGKQPPEPPMPAYERALLLAARIIGGCFRFAVLNAVAYGLIHAVPRARGELAFFAGAYAVLAAWLRRLVVHRARRAAAPEPEDSPSSWDWWRWAAAKIVLEALGEILCLAFAYRVAALAGSSALAVLVWCVTASVLLAGLYVVVYCFRKDQQQYRALDDADGDDAAGGGGGEGKAVEKITSADEMV